jgi:hypothetical protein
MNIKKGLQMTVLAAAATLGLAREVSAGTGQGSIGILLVGRLGYQVYVQLANASFANFGCGTPNTTSWQFAFSTQNPGGREMLATVLAAKASGAQLYIVGTGGCTQDPSLEDVSYVIAL